MSSDIQIIKRARKADKIKETIKSLIKKIGGDEKLTKRRYRKRSKYPRCAICFWWKS